MQQSERLKSQRFSIAPSTHGKTSPRTWKSLALSFDFSLIYSGTPASNPRFWSENNPTDEIDKVFQIFKLKQEAFRRHTKLQISWESAGKCNGIHQMLSFSNNTHTHTPHPAGCSSRECLIGPFQVSIYLWLTRIRSRRCSAGSSSF